MVVGADNICKTTPFLESFSTAQGAATALYSVIDRSSKIDGWSEEGNSRTPDSGETICGTISFENVHFHYPSRTEVPVLQGLNLHITSGQTVALVGGSGNGKSTCLQLLQRFYDPVQGVVRLDGRNVRDMHVASVRRQIAVVGQEPVLFATTIEENIRYGRPRYDEGD